MGILMCLGGLQVVASGSCNAAKETHLLLGNVTAFEAHFSPVGGLGVKMRDSDSCLLVSSGVCCAAKSSEKATHLPCTCLSA